MALTAVLTGTYHHPELRLQFGWGARLTTTNQPVQDWVKALPGRRWDKAEGCWYITATGRHPDKVLADAGIDVDYSEATGRLAGLDSLATLWKPLAGQSREYPANASVLPRMAGFEAVSARLGPGAVWDKNRQLFSVPLSDLLDEEGNLKRGLIPATPDLEYAARARLTFEGYPEDVALAAAELASSTGCDDDAPTVPNARTLELIDTVAAHTGRLPEWFGMSLFPYQLAGVYAAAAGHNLIADEPGLGKTRTSLAVAAVRGARRLVIVCPPLVLTHWGRDSVAGLARSMPAPAPEPAGVTSLAGRRKKKAAPKKKPEFPDWVCIIRPGRKIPAFPDQGAVIIADSLLAARPELLQDLIAWSPDVVIADEVHRLSSWSSARGTAVRNLVWCSGAFGIPLTGTPMRSKPVEMANIMAISGHLERVFRGASRYIDNVAVQDKFGGWKPRKQRLGALGRKLNRDVWTRRNKKDVLKQLPGKWRSLLHVDIDPKGFKQAHADLYAKIAEWVDQQLADYGFVSEDMIATFAKESIGLMSPLRVAAGVAKVKPAIEYVKDWLENTTDKDELGRTVYTRPLIVWAHHKEVLEALRSSATEAMGAEIIDGSTPSARRQEIADRFQDGKIGVLFASITAAGFGLTLTRSSDAVFVEQDWTPANISQAEDRVFRIGQTEPVMITTLFSRETLDPSVRAVLKRKAEDLEKVLPGADNHVTRVTAVLDQTTGEYVEADYADDEAIASVRTEADIIRRIVEEIVEQRTTAQRGARRAA